MAIGEEYIPKIVDEPWANLEQVAQTLGRNTDVREYADPRRVDQELAEGERHVYEEGDPQRQASKCLQDLMDSV